MSSFSVGRILQVQRQSVLLHGMCCAVHFFLLIHADDD